MNLSETLAIAKEKANEEFGQKHNADVDIKDTIYESKSKLTGYVTNPTSTPREETVSNLIKTINKLHQ